MDKFNSFDQLDKLKDRFKDEKEVLPPPQNLPVGNENNDAGDSFTAEEKFEEHTEENIGDVQYDDVPQEKDVYLIGGSDAEMQLIKKRIKKAGQEYVDKDLKWGAKVEDYSNEISEILESGDIPVAIELAGAETIDGVVDIDHHNEKSNRPASLLQVMDRLGLKPSLFDELIAANDSAYIPGMEKKLEQHRYQIESKTGKDGFEKIKTKLIQLVRSKDREAQGITKEQEKQAEEAIQKREDLYNNTLTIVRMPHSKSATVTDRAYGTYENLFVPSEDGESNFFGNGKLCKELHDTYQGSWAGGSGLGSSNGKAYWGGYPDQAELEDFIKEKTKNLSESFSRFDTIFTPEDTSGFKELGKKVFELGSFERMNEAVDVSKVEIIDSGKNFIITLKAKDGWTIYSVDGNKLFSGDSKYMLRRREAQNTFGFSGEGAETPDYLFVREGEELPEKISRGLKKKESISFQKGEWSNGKYYEVIQKFPAVENAIQEEFKKIDPRSLEYVLGEVDLSPQKNWKTRLDTSDYDRHMGRYIEGESSYEFIERCKDFEILHLTYESIKKAGDKVFITTPTSLSSLSADSIKEWYQRLENTLSEFESPINRAIQQKRIEYLKRGYEYANVQEKEVESIKNSPELLEKYFSKYTIENPLEIQRTYQGFKKLDAILKGRQIALYSQGNFYNAFDGLKVVGHYDGLKLKDNNIPRLDDFIEAIKPINSSLRLSKQMYSFELVLDSLAKAGFQVEELKNRGESLVVLPKVKINVDVVEFEESGGCKILYKGEVPVEINDPQKKEEAQRIIDTVQAREKNKEIKQFVNEFRSKGDGVTAIIRTGGTEKYQLIPDRFKELATMRVSAAIYDNLLLDTEAIQGKKSITVKVPDNMKGLVIGKGGSKIKRLQEELGLQIRIV